MSAKYRSNPVLIGTIKIYVVPTSIRGHTMSYDVVDNDVEATSCVYWVVFILLFLVIIYSSIFDVVF